MSSTSVHIVLSDRGWILEKLASKLKTALPFVDYDTEVDPSADIQYYMTYSTWKSRVSRIEMGYFAHAEQDDATRKKFFDVAKTVDFCVCHSTPYEKLLSAHGVESLRTIPPGVDLELFVPKLNIGVVGRTYHTGRKGERVVAGLMDLPGIEWHFTGEGWPGPALNLSNEEMPNFYRSMNYILVPSLYEGGPMSVVEALACGCEVIAPPIGWVPDYPHIEYKTGDVEDLRRVLTGLVEKRFELRQSVLHRGWDAWINGHREVFETLGRGLAKSSSIAVPGMDLRPRAVHRPGIIVHGSEKGVDKGGPSVRAPTTVKRLSRLGYQATLLDALAFDQRSHDLYHIFNLSRIASCKGAIEYTRLSNAPVILSTIYLDPSERQVSEVEITDIFRQSFSPAMINDEYARIQESAARRLARREADKLAGDFHADVRQLIGMVDHIICLSEHERNLLQGIGADVSKSTIVRNPVDAHQYSSATPDLFREAYGLTDYVLCVGRLEPRKNQITLLHALRDTKIPVVLVGHAPDPAYKQLLRSAGGPNVTFIDRLPPNSRMLASAFVGARVFCLPSWSEGAPLAALEAAAAASNMVLSNRSSEREYFGERARYCDPGDPKQMASVIQEAFERPFDSEQCADLSRWVGEQFSWEKHVAETAAVYEKVAESGRANAQPLNPQKIYIDLTSGANRSGPPSGIARVEERYALDLYELLPNRVVFIIWNSARRAFIEISHDQFTQYKHKELHNNQAPAHLFDQRNFAPYASANFEPNSILLVLGGAWIRNENYIHSLAATKRVKRLSLVIFVHDVIQGKFKHWFPEKIGDEFVRNCRIIVNASDHIIVNSQCTLDDLRDMSIAENMTCPPVDTLRFGDEIEKSGSEYERPQFDEILPLTKGQSFILYVSALDVRKNHILLYNVWERMLAEYGEKTPHLIMVGSKGWNIDHFFDLVNSNDAIKKVFHILHGINDATLSWLYRHCMFTVYPSHYEGWGLPVAESLNYGKVCVAARAGSVPEIAPQSTDLIDPLDFATWYKTITNYAFNSNFLATRQRHLLNTYKPQTWRQSAEKLRDILLNVSGRRRPLPVLQVNVSLPFDDRTGNVSRETKIGGWYSPEKDGTWTLGWLATLQFRLEGRTESALIMDLAGRGFTGAPVSLQKVSVVCNSVTVGELNWNGDAADDILVIPRDLAAELLSANETLLEFHIAHPLVPANVRPNNTDRRQLGIMVKSIGFRSALHMPLNSWMSTGSGLKRNETAPKPAIAHRSSGGLSYKTPLLLDGAVKSEALAYRNVVFVGLRFSVSNDEAAPKESLLVELRIGVERVGQVLLARNQTETRFFPLSLDRLKSGIVLEVFALDAKNSDFEITEYGLFSAPAAKGILRIPSNVVVSLSGQRENAAAEKVATAHWGLDRLHKAEGQSIAPIFVAGWSNFEANGIWSDGDRASQLMRVNASGPEPILISFEVRAFQPMRVEVRANGRIPIFWTFSSREVQQKVFVFQPEAGDDGTLFLEYEFSDAASPALVNGGPDTRKLGIRLSSFAVVNLDTLSLLTKRQKFPLLGPNTLVECATATAAETVQDQARPQGGAGGLRSVIPAKEAAAMLLAGWGWPERGGCWLDGDLGYLYLKPKAELQNASDLSLSFVARPHQSSSFHVRVNGGEVHDIAFKSTRLVDYAVPLPANNIERGYLVEYRIDRVTAPDEGPQSSDMRRLGILLKSFSISEPGAVRPVPVATAAKSETVPADLREFVKEGFPPMVESTVGKDTAVKDIVVKKRESPPASPPREKAQPSPIIVDFSAEASSNPKVIAKDWFEEEPHGRWSKGASGYLSIAIETTGSDPARMLAILRVTGSQSTGNRSIAVLVDGVECGQMTVEDDDFHLLDVDVTSQVAGKSSISVEFRCGQAFNPKRHGISEDDRDLGLHLRGLVIAPVSSRMALRTLLPGVDLVDRATAERLNN